MRERWTAEQAWEWYQKRPWVMGINYVPSITLHGIELWQEDTYPEVIPSVRREFELMEDIGLNGVRMFLPFSVWYYDREKFLDRVDGFSGGAGGKGNYDDAGHFQRLCGLRKARGHYAAEKVTDGRKYDIGHHGGHRIIRLPESSGR